ncbi:MAG: aminotransferase class V-fold PLP-dependent enzyme [Verrucomicrobiae bacterium]|nr:aminotransferase class V-fold PLP-dependent enzyme [Verrucomicrobiae bacterium]
MSEILERLDRDEAWRREEFPVAKERVFMAHAAVTALPRRVVDAMNAFNEQAATGELDYTEVLIDDMDAVRESAARLIGAKSKEIALLGPTSLGLSLVARGLDWKAGDEIICFREDYPANVYPWTDLERIGVKVIQLDPEMPGQITPELVASVMTDRTRLVALASCHFLTGYRIDIDAIGKLAHERGALFCLDAIQTTGAFPTTVEHVDFLSADAHKWMLGPMTAGIFYVAELHFETLRPSLLGAWNVKCPQFIAQDAIDFEPGGRRYEPGVLNASGLHGLKAAIDLLMEVGIDRVGERLLWQKRQLVEGLKSQGYQIAGPEEGPNASGITTITHEEHQARIPALIARWQEHGIVVSPRRDREGRHYARLSPHFYNTAEEIERVKGFLG